MFDGTILGGGLKQKINKETYIRCIQSILYKIGAYMSLIFLQFLASSVLALFYPITYMVFIISIVTLIIYNKN